jgi:hypothetical protein
MKNLFIYFGLTLFILTSCKEKIEVEMENAEPLLVVEAEVTTETDSSYVRLTLSANYYSSEPNPIVKTASVSINNIPFTFVPASNIYKAPAGFIGKTDTIYNLLVSYNGKEYKSQAKLEPMFQVDSFFQTWKEAQGFLPAGYSLSYAAFDAREPIKYTYYQQFLYDSTSKSDTSDGNLIFFDNSLTPINQAYNFEIPFLRLNSGAEYVAVFRSVDKNMYEFLNAFGNQNPDIPGPFQVPPANLPTNITGGAVGYFATYDVKRWRYKVR